MQPETRADQPTRPAPMVAARAARRRRTEPERPRHAGARPRRTPAHSVTASAASSAVKGLHSSIAVPNAAVAARAQKPLHARQ